MSDGLGDEAVLARANAAGGISASASILLIGLLLRLKGLHNPLLDHPGWRQGDTASIARNFLRLQYNIMFPQTDVQRAAAELRRAGTADRSVYRGDPLQRLRGASIFGRLITMAFSLGTIAVVAASAAGCSRARTPDWPPRSSSPSFPEASTTAARSRPIRRWCSFSPPRSTPSRGCCSRTRRSRRARWLARRHCSSSHISRNRSRSSPSFRSQA